MASQGTASQGMDPLWRRHAVYFAAAIAARPAASREATVICMQLGAADPEVKPS